MTQPSEVKTNTPLNVLGIDKEHSSDIIIIIVIIIVIIKPNQITTTTCFSITKASFTSHPFAFRNRPAKHSTVSPP